MTPEAMRQAEIRWLFGSSAPAPEHVQEASPRRWQVVALTEGRNRNGAFYSPEVLRQSLPLFEGLPVVAHSDRLSEMGHDETVYRPSIPRGRKARVVGFLRCPHLSVGGSVLSPGLTRVICDLEVTNRGFQPFLEASWKRIAFSIDGEGESVRDFIDGRFLDRILRLTKLHELTLVSCPAGCTRLYPAC